MENPEILKKVKELREITGVGFKDCKLAIDECNGDIDLSIDYLRKKGISKANKKMERVAAEGMVAIKEKDNKICIVEVNCETDFVAKNDDFINFVKELSEINNELNSDLEKLKKTNMKNNKSVEENLVSMIAKIGEKITLGRSKTINHKDSKNYFYIHTVVKDNLGKLGVIASIAYEGSDDKVDIFGKQLSMHIAASNPISININDINEEILSKEEQLISEELKNSGKSDDIIKKISEGKIKKFKEENSLLTQQWVMEPKKKVQDVIDEFKSKKILVKEFFRIKIGE